MIFFYTTFCVHALDFTTIYGIILEHGKKMNTIYCVKNTREYARYSINVRKETRPQGGEQEELV